MILLILILIAAPLYARQARLLRAAEPALCPAEEERIPLSTGQKALARFSGIDPEAPLDTLEDMLPGVASVESKTMNLGFRVRETKPPEKTAQTASALRYLPAETPEVPLPVILIYHTHTHEAYNPLDGTAYKEKTGKWRTTDPEFNVIRVGETLSELLRLEGFTVYHDTSDYEMPSLNGAYDRSLAGVEKICAEHPEITVFIDLHRDAYTQGRIVSVEVDGQACAQLMFVVGDGSATGFRDLPDVEANTALAQRAMDALARFSPDLVRRMSKKTGRYNQHLSDTCMLIEVGHNLNTLEEALASVPYLARALKTALAQ